ncbi:MAG: TetR/AcrR family transcriptional regulator, partial [Ruminococcus sp.]|nr:TetR/AcrR family transcriptional regulator [Candidatus Copronaster equi]
LSKAAFYKHYKSKEEIWNTVQDEMEAYYDEHFGSSDNLPPIPKDTDELKMLTLQMLNFTMHDEKIIIIRKILLSGQFRDKRICALATKHFHIGLESMFTEIFKCMVENDVIKKNDPAMLAFVYTAPVSSLVHLCDREPEKETEIMAKTEAFIDHFIKIYGNN